MIAAQDTRWITRSHLKHTPAQQSGLLRAPRHRESAHPEKAGSLRSHHSRSRVHRAAVCAASVQTIAMHGIPIDGIVLLCCNIQVSMCTVENTVTRPAARGKYNFSAGSIILRRKQADLVKLHARDEKQLVVKQNLMAARLRRNRNHMLEHRCCVR